ncbi:hypothetical protein CU002_1887 [Enterococcus faecium]|nr:hypothetical protein [Enterococcus faecium]
MMYQIEENLLKLAYTKGISSQGKWALALIPNIPLSCFT